MDLTKEQWKIVEPLLPKPKVREDGGGRPWRDPQDVLNGILWVMRTGAPWKDLPDRYPPYQTCHRRLQMWVKSGALEKVLRALAEDLKERGEIDLTEAFIDGSFGQPKMGPGVGPTKRGKGTKIMAITDRGGLPVAIWIGSARPHETRLVEGTLDKRFLRDLPVRLIGDKAYDSDKLDAHLADKYNVELIAPHRGGRKTKTQDGRKLKRYKRRWKVELLFAWLQRVTDIFKQG